MPSHHVRPILDDKLGLAEGPVWHDDCLWFVDINANAVHRLSGPDLLTHDTWDVGERVGAALPAEEAQGGRWLLACQGGLYAWTPGREKQHLVDPESHLPGNRFNDAKTAPDGVAFLGTMALDEPREGRGTLWRYDGRDATAAVTGVAISNGLAWSADGKTMWYVDTPTGRVDAFDYTNGRVSNRRPVVTGFPGKPDGMCAADDDTLFVAQWDGGCVVHCDPHTGKHLARIDIPAKNVTSCAFGGDDFDTLYVTTAGGGVFAVEATGRRGTPPTLAPLPAQA